MFNQYLLTLINQQQEYKKLKIEVSKTPLEKSIEHIIKKINDDIDKITQLNQIDYVY
ncbi:MAG: hypothetical protein ACFE9S_10375 [Candidatus Hermodarchaeota archaeon]